MEEFQLSGAWLTFEFKNSSRRFRFVPRCNVNLGAPTNLWRSLLESSNVNSFKHAHEMLHGTEANASAKITNQANHCFTHNMWTHLPPVTIATLPLRFDMCCDGSKSLGLKRSYRNENIIITNPTKERIASYIEESVLARCMDG